ncbi:MAG: DUF4190 domain-containing protein [Deltaproteobacteria bacterium]|nr:DUF4190 domain-containing protein [Deltaproteobacteria bacterium]
MEQNDNRPIIILVLGILGLVACQVFGPIAWIMGNNYRRSCIMEGTEPEQLGNVGRILGMVGTGLLILTFGLVILMVILQVALISLS